MSSMNVEDTAAALHNAAVTKDLPGFAKLLASVPVNRISALGKKRPFHEALDLLATLVTDAPDPVERLTALSLLGKAESSVQRREPAVERAVRRALQNEPPRLVLTGASALDFNARRYIAEMLDRAEGDWVARYAAQALLDEERSDQARLSFALVLCDRSNTLSEAFELLSLTAPKSLHAVPGTKDAALARAKRTARLLPAISEALRQTTTETGEELDARVHPLFQALLLRFNRPNIGMEGEDATAAAVAAGLTFLATLVRTRFSISTSADTYASVSALKRWLNDTSWPRGASTEVSRLERSIVEAITLQARLGRPPRELLSILLTLIGDRQAVEARLKRIAAVPGLDHDIRAWLLAGGTAPPRRFNSDHAVEAGLRDADELLGAAAIRADRTRRRLERINLDALPAVRANKSVAEHAVTLTQFANEARALLDDLASVLRRRSLHLFGDIGEVLPADPSRQETRDGRLIDTAEVKVQSPGVLRRISNGNEAVVRKAIVEMVE